MMDVFFVRAQAGSRAGWAGFGTLGAGLTLGFCVLLAAATLSQEVQVQETRSYRVYLKSGSVVDAEFVRETPRSVILMVPSGEIVIRREAIDRIEVVKTRLRPAEAPAPAVAPRRTESPGALQAQAPVSRARIDAILQQYPTASDGRRQDLLRELAKAVPSSLSFLVWRLETAEGPARSLISAALVESRSAVPPAALEPALKSWKADVRAEAARILGGLESPASVPPLAALVRDPSPAVRSAAVHALGLLGTPEAFQTVTLFSGDASREVRLQALHALPVIAAKSELSSRLEGALLDAFDRAEGAARADVVAVMGVSGCKGLLRCLFDALRDGAPEVRAASVTALVNLGAFEWKEWVASRYLCEEDPLVRMALASAAQNLKFPGAIEPLISWLRSSDEGAVQSSLSALKVLTGKDFGPDAELWTSWWASARRR